MIVNCPCRIIIYCSSLFQCAASKAERSYRYSSEKGTEQYFKTITTGVRSPAEAKDFSSSLCAQTCSEAHPASYQMGTGGPFQGVNRGRGVTLTTHPHLVSRSRMSRSYTSFPPSRLHGLQRDSFTLLFALIR
jgi:hypothetical protein